MDTYTVQGSSYLERATSFKSIMLNNADSYFSDVTIDDESSYADVRLWDLKEPGSNICYRFGTIVANNRVIIGSSSRQFYNDTAVKTVYVTDNGFVIVATNSNGSYNVPMCICKNAMGDVMFVGYHDNSVYCDFFLNQVNRIVVKLVTAGSETQYMEYNIHTTSSNAFLGAPFYTQYGSPSENVYYPLIHSYGEVQQPVRCTINDEPCVIFNKGAFTIKTL